MGAKMEPDVNVVYGAAMAKASNRKRKMLNDKINVFFQGKAGKVNGCLMSSKDLMWET